MSSASPTRSSNPLSDQAFALSKYHLLHTQHEALQQHLNSLSPSPPSTPPHTHHPPRLRNSFSSSLTSCSDEDTSQHRPRRFSMLTHAESQKDSVDGERLVEEDKLKDVNMQIKSTLTELLNSEGVKSNQGWRAWVQERLMEAEKEIKEMKCRRLSDGAGAL